MKNLMKSIVIVGCLLFLSTASYAVESKNQCKNNSCQNFQISMYRVQNSLTMKLMMEKTKGERVLVRLKNSQGQIVYQESIAKSATKLGRDLNFSDSEDGKYSLEISDGREVIVKDISLTTQDIKVSSNRTLVAMN